MNKYNKIVFVNGSAPPLNADNLNHMDEGIERATDGAIALETEIATARGGSNSLGARLDTVDTNLANKADKASTLAGYGIVNAYTKTEMLNFLTKKEDNLNKVNSKTDITDRSTNYPSIEYLGEYYYDANEVYSSEETDKLLATKYDSSNIESGTSTLTPYSTIADKIKSASCTYKTIGDIVIVSATVKMNAATIGANSTYPLIDLPYKCIAEDNVFCVGISNLGKVFKFAVLKNNTWLQFQTQDKTAYTFADGEQINVICLYKIK